MNDEIRLDRETFKALAADTRISILKSLAKRRMTGAELASQVKLSPSTIKEHLDQLEQAKLIEQMDEGRKWKYYALTFKGRQITSTERPSMRVWIVLGVSILALAFTTMNLFFLPTEISAANGALATSQGQNDLMVASAAGAAEPAAAKAFNAPAAVQVDSCSAAPNSCLSSESIPAGQSADAAPQLTASRAAYSTAESGNTIPTKRQVSMIDLALEAALVLLVLGLGYYALTQNKKAAI
jgi:DNA-binding transcriptional ArsR family regulator